MTTDAEMEELLGENERIDDLQCNGYRLIQNTACFCFGMDAVLLSSFAKAGGGDRVLDLGTGNGVIPILMHGKHQGIQCVGLEIQEVSAELAKRNVLLNGIEKDVTMVQGDIKNAVEIFGAESFDVAMSNPPYMSAAHGLINPDGAKAIARHELLCTLADVMKAAAGCLKFRGRFYMVHRPQRLAEIFEEMRAQHLEPKRMRLVHSYWDSDANMALIEGIKGGNAQLTVEPPLVLYNRDGSYTEGLLALYKTQQENRE